MGLGGSTVGSIVDPGSIVAFAYGEANTANQFALTLGNLIGNLSPPTITPTFPTQPAAPPLSVVTPPQMQSIVWQAPNIPADFTGTVNVDDLMPQPFDVQAPPVIYGAAPLPPTDVEPDAPAVDLTYTMPDLNVELPAPPALLQISVTPFSGINLPTIDPTVPVLNLSPPSIINYTPGAMYTSSVLQELQTLLQSWLDGTDTGLGSDAEQAIWDRGREREMIARQDKIDSLERYQELGYALPPGVWLDAQLKILNEADAQDRGLSREIVIKEAELEQANVHKAMDVARELESNLMQYNNQVEQRIFESCKYATEAGVEIYKAQVQTYAVYLDAFKARIEIYRAQIQAQLALVDAYKAMIAAEQAKADVNRALIESYKTQVDAALSAVEIFKAQVFAIQAKAEIEKSKIEIFGEQVKAYTAKIGAYTAGVEGYRASIQAEATKQEAFKAQVDAYSATVNAATRVIEARVEAFRGNIAAYTARLDGYKAQIQGEAERNRAIAESNTSLSETYRAQVTGIASYNEVLTKQWTAAIEESARITEIAVSVAKANAELYVTTRQTAIEAAKVGAQVSAQLGAAALNAVSWHNNFSQSESDSTSNNTSTIESTSLSQSTNYNYSL
jgi:hypothetical protein